MRPQPDEELQSIYPWQFQIRDDQVRWLSESGEEVLGRSSVDRQFAFAQERGWRDLNFIQTIGDEYANDLKLIDENGFEWPALVVYRRDGDQVRLFWASEMSKEMADPKQDPRDAPDIASLWTVLDLTPEGRGADWYPKLNY